MKDKIDYRPHVVELNNWLIQITVQKAGINRLKETHVI